jgi:PAS domain S-box-containing protein
MLAQPHPNARPAVLLVDDSPQNLLALEALLEPLGLELVRAASGEEALRLVLEKDFALILLDVQMPGMDGIETARRIKGRARSRALPIIFLTAIDADPARIAAGYEAGAVDYLPKPINPHALLSKVRTFAALDAARRETAAQSALLAEAAAREAELLARTATEARAAEALRALNRELKEARDAAERARRMQAALLDSTAEGIYGIDAAGLCTFINRAASRMLGYTPAECIGRDMHALVHHHRADGSPYPREECPICRASRIGQPVRVEDEVLWRSDGSSFPAEYASSPVLEGGELHGAVVTFTDITEWRAAEAEREQLLARVQAEREQLLRVFESAPAVMAIFSGPDHVISRVNPTWERTVGKPGAVGRTFREVFPEFGAVGAFELLDRVYRTGEPYARPEVRLPMRRFGSGELEDSYWNFVWLPLPAAEGRDIVLHAVEMTEQVRARKAMERHARALQEKSEEAEGARRAAEMASRAKSEFLANMSHEIRTPINAVMGYTDLLELEVAGPVTDRQREYLNRITGSSRHLLGLVNDVLDLAKVEAGRMTVARERGDAARSTADAVSLVLPQAVAKEIALEDRTDGGPYEFVGDNDRVRQVLVNLLSNAVKFTGPGGRVTIDADVTDRPPRDAHVSGTGPWVCVRVADTGRGIAADQTEAVFQPFVQAEAGRTRTEGGTGLGLTISREFARLMGGDLTVKSEPGEGAIFTLWLPAAAASAAPVRAEDRARGVAQGGEALVAAVDTVMEAFVSRLRADEAVPAAAGCARVELEDHVGALLADLGQDLVIASETGGERELRRDGSDLRHFVAERHGRQRARLGWTDDALRREYAILGDEVAAAVRRALPLDPDAAEVATAALARLLDRAEQVSLEAIRAAGDDSAALSRTRDVIEATRRTIGRVKSAVYKSTAADPDDA